MLLQCFNSCAIYPFNFLFISQSSAAHVQQLYKQESCEYFSLDVVVAMCSIALGIQIIVPEMHDLTEGA